MAEQSTNEFIYIRIEYKYSTIQYLHLSSSSALWAETQQHHCSKHVRDSNESQDFEVFRSIFYYCFFILIVPLLSFFCAKFIIFDPFFGSSVNGSVYSAIVAIVSVHIALGLYIYKAYSEPPKQVKRD